MSNKEIFSKLIEYANKSSKHTKFKELLEKQHDVSLINTDFKINIFGKIFKTTLLYYLFSIDNYELSEYLLNNFNVDIYCGYDLHLMSNLLNLNANNVKYIKLLIKHGYEINHQCINDNSTLLHMACIANNSLAVDYLIKNGSVAFNYVNGPLVSMDSIIFGSIDRLTPLNLCSELLNESSIKICGLLLSTITNLNLLINLNDIDDLVKAAFNKSCYSILNTLDRLNFNFSLFEQRLKQKNRFSIDWNNDTWELFEFFKKQRVRPLKELCRLTIRSSLANVNQISNLLLPNYFLGYLMLNY
jgi:ankyrin repeat protein